MSLRDTFKQDAEGSEFNLFTASPIKLGKLAHTGSVSSLTNPWVAATSHDPDKKKDKEQRLSDLAQLAEQSIQQAYEQFQNTYDDAMAFYEDADTRLDDLEGRIKTRLNDIENRTELLTDENGSAVYRDEHGGFYKVENGQRIAITEEEEIEALRDKAKAIEASGQTVRTENEQGIFIQLQVALTETMDIKRDAGRNKDEADEWKRRVEEDPSLAPEGDKHIQKGKSDIEERMKEMEERVTGLDATKDKIDKQLTADQAPEASTVNEWKSSIPTEVPPVPPAGL
ncbi:MAG: hypothetical protein DBP00_07370 [gamma proteobacterium symbiont of Ctena orbiculata]|nr:MAG: hypothetical protein DBP00_07370 [gamma proteobacterium symbiont of Ctena orbiculata]